MTISSLLRSALLGSLSLVTLPIFAQDATEDTTPKNLEGTFLAHQEGTTLINDSWTEQTMEREYTVTLSLDDTVVTLSNVNGLGEILTLTGTYDAESQTITFAPQKFQSYRASGSADTEADFTATASGDLETLTFSPWMLSYLDTPYEQTETMILTRVASPEKSWEIGGNLSWTKADGTPSDYNTDISGITLSQYVVGDKVAYYELSGLGSSQPNATPQVVRFTVEGNGVMNFTNSYYPEYPGYYLYINNQHDYCYLEGSYDGVAESNFSGDEISGKFTCAYWYAPNFNSTFEERGKLTFWWVKDSNFEVELPESASSLADLMDFTIHFNGAVHTAVAENGLLGAIYDEQGKMQAVAFADPEINFYGYVETGDCEATIHFESLASIQAKAPEAAATLSSRIASKIQPQDGVLVYICPNSFVIDRQLYEKSITQTYTINQTTTEKETDEEQHSVENAQTISSKTNNFTSHKLFDLRIHRTTLKPKSSNGHFVVPLRLSHRNLLKTKTLTR